MGKDVKCIFKITSGKNPNPFDLPYYYSVQVPFMLISEMKYN